MKLDLFFEPRHLWIGIYWTIQRQYVGNRFDRWLLIYLCLIPCVPLRLALVVDESDEDWFEVDVYDPDRYTDLMARLNGCHSERFIPLDDRTLTHRGTVYIFDNEAIAEHFQFLLRGRYRTKRREYCPF